MDVHESNTAYAQGGVAVVLHADEHDTLELHMADTVKVGCGINDLDAVRSVITEGPARVRELIDWGTRFDSHGGELDLGREAGHSAYRVVHAHGDHLPGAGPPRRRRLAPRPWALGRDARLRQLAHAI